MIVSIITLGCKVNEYESQSMLAQFKKAGYEIKEGLVFADIYVLNTCAVTNIGERKSKQALAKIEKLNPNAKIIACGCAVQNNPKNFLDNKQVVAVVGNNGKHDIINNFNCSQTELMALENNKYKNMEKPIETKTRQYIKIQDGCDYFCTYCLIPYLRGRSRSRDILDIINEIKHTKAKEIVLTGINMSDYRIDGKLALNLLIKEVDKLNKQFRISSIECNVLTDEMIETLKNCKNFCPHFHLSLQSACNETLKRMNRHYTIEKFKSIVKKLRKNFPTCCVSTDLIVGFKGETDEEFNETINNLKDIKFDFMHIFPYSVRSGTVASKLKGDVDKNIVKQREKILQELNSNFKKEFYNKNLNTTHKLLVEEIDGNILKGYTDNYIYAEITGKAKVNDIILVKLTGIKQTIMKGEKV